MRSDSGIALDGAADDIGDDMNGAHIRMALRRARIDRDDPRMSMRRTQQPRVQHARQLDIDGKACGAGHLGASIDPWH